MKKTFRSLLSLILIACLSGCVLSAHAQDSDDSGSQNDRQIVAVGHNAELPAGNNADEIVSVMGSSKADGNLTGDAVAVLGDLSVTGNVGGDAVAVLGDVYVNGKVNGDVVAVLGNVKLGPQAVVGGQVTEVMGALDRSPTAVVQGGTVHVLSGMFSNIEGLHAWFRDCLVMGRPLAPTLDVAWAWWLALATLAFYIVIAAIFKDGVRRCVQTLEAHPGPSLLSTIILVLLVPVVMLALVITVVGIAVIPLFWIAVLCAGVFGRVVALAWLGGRCLGLANARGTSQPVLDVLVGGLIMLALYMVPILGFFLYMLLGVFGFGAVVYMIVLATRSSPAKPAGTAGGTTQTPNGTAQGATWTADSAPSGTGWSGARSEPTWTAAVSEPPHAASGSADDVSAGSPPPPPPPGAAASGPAAAAGPAAAGPAAAGPAHPMLDLATLPRAGFWIRMLALLIDLILVGFAMHLLDRHSNGTLIVLAAYAAIMWKLKGTTVGGIVCDLKVVRVSGGPLDWGTAIIRALGCFLSLVIACLGFIWIAIDHEHQAWHDKIAGTVVVRVPKGVGLV